MATANLERFRLKIREYRLLVNRNQSDLAAYLNLDYNELSNRLNAHKNVRLSHENVRGIVRALAEWGAITTQAQAEELLDLMLCPHFDAVDWQARPLSKLAGSQATAITSPTTGSTFKPAQLNENKLPVPVSKPEPIHNLPKQLSSFIGRQKEVAELKIVLSRDKARLLSLIGAGGCGKTRLSLQISTEVLDSFRDGVWLVELAPLSDPALIPQTIATALGLAEQPGLSIQTTLNAYLRSRQLLLVLDNCEHLIEECARQVDSLLQVSNDLQVLITSREAFGIRGETTFRVPSLTLPGSGTIPEVELLIGYEGIRLFKERAIESNPRFAITSQNAGAVLELCRRLDGIPLAIELAAARIKVLTVEQIVARLDDRFRLLTGGSRTALPRQQTLHALIDWSYELLSVAEKRLFSYLSIFAGGWSLPAALAICENTGDNQASSDEFTMLDTLTGLVNKSLVQVTDNTTKAETRYFMLETIRQYGLEKLKALGEIENVRQRHLVYYAFQAQELELKLQGQQQLETIKWLDQEIDNLRVAIDNSLGSGKFEATVQIVTCLYLYWEIRGNISELRQYLEQALELSGANGIILGKALYYTGFIAARQGDMKATQHYFEECFELNKQHNDTELNALAYTGLGVLNAYLGNYTISRPYFEKALAVAEGMNLFYKSAAQGNLGIVLTELGEFEEASRILEEAVVIMRKVNNRWIIPMLLIQQARIALVFENYPAAYSYMEELLKISDEIGYQLNKPDALAYQGMARYHEKKLEEASHLLGESLVICLKGGLRNQTSNTLVGVVGLLSEVWLTKSNKELLEQVASLCGAISALQAAVVFVSGIPFRNYYQQALKIARSSLNEAEFEEAFARGQTMPLEEAIAYARKALSLLNAEMVEGLAG